MPLWQAIVLGAVQGLTEFLPISSTAHLALIPWAFGWRDPGLTFDVALHVGTLAAVLIYFWKVWRQLLVAGMRTLWARRLTAVAADSADLLRDESTAASTNPGPEARRNSAAEAIDPETRQNARLLFLLIIGSIPGGIAGLLFEHHIETTLRSPLIMGGALIVVAFLMQYADNLRVGSKKLSDLRLWDSVAVGGAQALALIPGVSRSGITMCAGLGMHFQRDTAARFSFLLSTPIIAGACLKKLLEVQDQGIAPDMVLPFAAGTLVSGLVGYATIAYFIKYLQFGTFRIFVYYRVFLGIMVLALAAFYRLSLTP